ncbi:flavin-containing monooxygenase [Novosphingopyxis iocasae]|uniref:flavin-containing monooxygenase n=1 Tax=Novosphingopyxis iocasae TaxID=2762729 RepID=UPI001650F2DA|nr:NAD(P)/FAD-dependent oxidoreductase [Novosphingopyxis iocasae]
MSQEQFDVLIVGAGLSGIGMAVHLQRDCPGKTFAILEQRDDLGGTWDLFQYPGIRSDSDMHTLGFDFEPWTEQKAIADGPSIWNYIHRIAKERDIEQHIRFGQKVSTAKWSSETALWTLESVDGEGHRTKCSARYLYLASGYYDYDKGHEPHFEGREDFGGQIVHPQFWPDDLDYSGKRVVVIGSGATAVTLVPSIAKKAAHVTMLQRTPTWYAIRPSEDAIANGLRKVLPDSTAYKLIRKRNVLLQRFFFNRARSKPGKVGEFLHGKIREALGGQMDEKDFTPPYNPWEQRLCLVPDADMFEALKAGDASIVTDHIDRFDETGIQLKSGEHLNADIIVTATGLKLAVAGKIAFDIDGEPVNFADRIYYKGSMFSGIPNLAAVFGYVNASWTLKADIVARYFCRFINTVEARVGDYAVPTLPANGSVEAEAAFDFSSGYFQRSMDILPKSGSRQPWKLNQDYLLDRKILLKDPIDDGELVFHQAGQAEHAPPVMAAAE